MSTMARSLGICPNCGKHMRESKRTEGFHFTRTCPGLHEIQIVGTEGIVCFSPDMLYDSMVASEKGERNIAAFWLDRETMTGMATELCRSMEQATNE